MADERCLHVDFQITTVDGDQGERLAVLQANAILEVLQWLADQQRDPHPGHAGPPSAKPSR